MVDNSDKIIVLNVLFNVKFYRPFAMSSLIFSLTTSKATIAPKNNNNLPKNPPFDFKTIVIHSMHRKTT